VLAGRVGCFDDGGLDDLARPRSLKIAAQRFDKLQQASPLEALCIGFALGLVGGTIGGKRLRVASLTV
jgi:hypothetical protein